MALFIPHDWLGGRKGLGPKISFLFFSLWNSCDEIVCGDDGRHDGVGAERETAED